eukprot:Gregarina_sp_Poly_1__6810@NODE_3680_length_932_cov_109_949133_g2350_i0_p1_GENE_NODE_3680_length_932_cov_109_949133_g2350_i0NODE_3680_length_932_cov_109_949133_g2350_i0_p1_ORF_typecomplete_len254_score20_32_NODE_3680_length_932_cov_109_949133_g2350_i050811
MFCLRPCDLFRVILHSKPREVTWSHVRIEESAFEFPNFSTNQTEATQEQTLTAAKSLERWQDLVCRLKSRYESGIVAFGVNYEIIQQALGLPLARPTRCSRMSQIIPVKAIRSGSVKLRPQEMKIMLVTFNDVDIAIQQLFALCVQEKFIDESVIGIHTCYLAHVPSLEEDCRAMSLAITCRALEFRFTIGEQPQITSSLPKKFFICSNGELNVETCRQFISFQQSLEPLDLVIDDLPEPPCLRLAAASVTHE